MQAEGVTQMCMGAPPVQGEAEDRQKRLSAAGGRFTQYQHVPAQNSKNPEKSKFETNIFGYFEYLFVKIEEKATYYFSGFL